MSNNEGKNSFTNLLGLEDAVAQTDRLAKRLDRELDEFDTSLSSTLNALLKKYLFRHH
jgi:hypothetical protein